MNYTFTDTTFARNKALLGAGLYATNSGTERPLSMIFTQCKLQGNFAEQSAGVAWLKGYKNVSFDECRVSSNSAGQSAGALYLQNTPAQITASVLAGNTARLAAALMLQGSSSAVQVTDSRLEGNKVCVCVDCVVVLKYAWPSLALSRPTLQCTLLVPQPVWLDPV
jgi:hypothetical protein